MPRAALALLAFLLLARVSPAQPVEQGVQDPLLQRAVEEAVGGFDGIVGVYVRHLPTGRTAALRADELFPTASMVKVPILVGVFERVEAGALDYREGLVYRDSLHYSDADLVGQLRDGARLSLRRAAEMMLSASDNTASLWLQELAGGGAAINAWLSAQGFDGTRVNSRTPGRHPDWERYGWGQTTPREMAELLRRVVEGEAVSPAADEAMHRLLTRSFYDGEALSALPPGVQAASKQGSVRASRSEVVYVHAPSGPYVFCVVTREQADQRYEDDNAGYVLLRQLSRVFWEAFEPGSAWAPAPGAERFRP